MDNSLVSFDSDINFSINDLYNGLLLLGDNAYGKNILKQNIQARLIKNGFGLSVIDPSGDNSQKLLGDIDSTNIIHIKPTKSNIGFNILNCPIPKSDPKYDNFVGTMASILTKRLEYKLNTKKSRIIYILILTAIRSEKIHTLEEFTYVLENKCRIKKFMYDHNVEKSYINYFENQDKNLINEMYKIMAKWTNNKQINEFISETNSKYNIYTAIQKNKILLLDLSLIDDLKSKKQISQFFLNRIWVCIRYCAAINNGHFLFINKYDSDTYYNIRDLISHSRSLKLGLCISVDDINKLSDNDKNQLYNLNNKIIFNFDDSNTKNILNLYDITVDTIYKLNKYEFVYNNYNKSKDIRGAFPNQI